MDKLIYKLKEQSKSCWGNCQSLFFHKSSDGCNLRCWNFTRSCAESVSLQNSKRQKSWEREKSEQMPSLLQHVHSQGYPEWRRSTLGATFFLEQSDGHAISVIIRETEVSREAVSHTFRCVHIKETRTENKNRMYWWQGWASHGKYTRLSDALKKASSVYLLGQATGASCSHVWSSWLLTAPVLATLLSPWPNRGQRQFKGGKSRFGVMAYLTLSSAKVKHRRGDISGWNLTPGQIRKQSAHPWIVSGYCLQNRTLYDPPPQVAPPTPKVL